MSSFQKFIHSRLLRHPTTWTLAVGAAGYGGVRMYNLREAKRAVGAPLHWPNLAMERSVDIAVGAALEIAVVACAVWFAAGLAEDSATWVRQLVLLVAYVALFALRYVL